MRATELHVLDLRGDAADDGRPEGRVHEVSERRTFGLFTPRRSCG